MTEDRNFNKANQEDKTEQPEEARGLPRVPPLSRWDTAMDEVIGEAMRNGDFDNLPGRGKPLNLSKSTFGAEFELAYGLLKNNDYTLPWITQRQEIFDQIAEFRSELQETWLLYAAEHKVTVDTMALRSLEAGWQHFLNTQASETITRVNKKIADITLKQPREVVEILKLNLKSELFRANAQEKLG